MVKIILSIILFIGVWTLVSFYWRGWQSSFEIWQLKRNPIISKKSYISVHDMQEDLNSKDPWIVSLWFTINYKFQDMLDLPRYIYRFFKRGIQRWKRGWSDEDVWGIDGYLNDIIPQMVKRLKDIHHGVPCYVGKTETDKKFEQADKKWMNILDEIIWLFNMNKKIGENRYFYQNSKNWSSKEYFEYNELWNDTKREYKPRSLDYDECIRHDKAWKLFRKYYFSLWD